MIVNISCAQGNIFFCEEWFCLRQATTSSRQGGETAEALRLGFLAAEKLKVGRSI